MLDEQSLELYGEIQLAFWQHIVSFCRKHSKDLDEAEVLCDKIIKAVRRGIGGLNPESSQRQRNRWLQRVMRTAYADYCRSQQYTLVPLEEALEVADGEAYDHELLMSLLEHLTPGERAFTDLLLKGYHVQEIPAMLGITLATAYQRYHRIVLKLRGVYYRLYADR